MGLRNGILIRIRKKHIRIGNKFDFVEGVMVTIGGIWADLSGNKFPAKLLTLQSPSGLLRGGGGP